MRQGFLAILLFVVQLCAVHADESAAPIRSDRRQLAPACYSFVRILGESMDRAFLSHGIPVLTRKDLNNHRAIFFGIWNSGNADVFAKAKALVQQAKLSNDMLNKRFRELEEKDNVTKLSDLEGLEYQRLQENLGYYAFVPHFYSALLEAARLANNPEVGPYLRHEGVNETEFDNEFYLEKVRKSPRDASFDNDRPEAAGVPDFLGNETPKDAIEFAEKHYDDVQIRARLRELVGIYLARAQANQMDGVYRRTGFLQDRFNFYNLMYQTMIKLLNADVEAEVE